MNNMLAKFADDQEMNQIFRECKLGYLSWIGWAILTKICSRIVLRGFFEMLGKFCKARGLGNTRAVRLYRNDKECTL